MVLHREAPRAMSEDATSSSAALSYVTCSLNNCEELVITMCKYTGTAIAGVEPTVYPQGAPVRRKEGKNPETVNRHPLKILRPFFSHLITSVLVILTIAT